eukprot:9851572-Alexandrium_andersonii.AAC.1
MSASLVGSEMCIRDSPSGLGLQPLRLRTTSLAEAEVVPGFHVEEAAAPCLLYTSDAADDM